MSRRAARRRHHLPVLLLTALAAILAAGCDRVVELAVHVPEPERAVWDRLVAQHPLPEAFVEVNADSRSASALLLDRRVAPALPPHAERRIVLERTWLAPAAPLWQAGRVLGASEPTPDRAGELVALREISLPLTALPVEGRVAGDEGYPYVQQLVLELRPDRLGLAADDEQREALAAWFARLPADERPAPSVAWLGGVGDLMVARGVTRLLDRADGLEVVFGDVLGLMQDVGLLLGNLEGAVTTRGVPLEKTFTFRFHPRVLGPLAEAGFDYLSVVNNHSWDYAEVGFRDTLAHLRASGMATSGAGLSLDEASRPYETVLGPRGQADSRTSVSPGGTAVRILSVGAYPLERSGFDGARETPAGPDRPGVLWADPRNPAAQREAFAAIEASFGPATFDVVMVHGGPEWALHPSAGQRELYRSFVDAGADLVLGHHSHVVQGLESYRGGLIAHSLGNFVFPGMFVTEFGEESIFLRIGLVDGEIRYVDPVPVRIDHQRISLDASEAILRRVRQNTRRLHE